MVFICPATTTDLNSTILEQSSTHKKELCLDPSRAFARLVHAILLQALIVASCPVALRSSFVPQRRMLPTSSPWRHATVRPEVLTASDLIYVWPRSTSPYSADNCLTRLRSVDASHNSFISQRRVVDLVSVAPSESLRTHACTCLVRPNLKVAARFLG